MTGPDSDPVPRPAPPGHAPEDILEMARRCPVASAHVAAWRRGGLTWEQAIVGLCVALKKQNDALFRQALELSERMPSVVLKEKP